MRQPRPYQTKLIEDARLKLRDVAARLARQGIERKPRLMLQSACGSGKTYMSALIAKSAVDRGGTVGFLGHRDFLMDQTAETYGEIGINHSYIAAGRWYNPWTPAHIGMIGSMKSRMSKVKAPTVCFIDEGHHSVATSYQAVIAAWPETTFLMLSATPGQRSDGRGLDEVCDDIVVGPQVQELIDLGALSDFDYYAPSTPDLSGMHTRMGEYVTSEIDAEMTKAVIVGNIVDSYGNYARGTRAIYFATTVQTSKMYADAFNAAGIRAAHLDADTKPWERTRIARAMADGDVQVMCNVGIATEGYDLAAQAKRDVTIETVGLCRPTKSLPLLIQMEMRAMRAKPYPGIILDHAGCYNEHQFLPSDHIEWTLAGSSNHTPSKTQECSGCMARLPAAAAVCKHCGEVLREAKQAGAGPRAEIEHVDGELQKIEKGRERAAKELEELQATSVHELIDIGKRRGYPDPIGWAAMMWTLKERRKKQKHLVDQQNLGFGAIREAAE